MYTGAMENHHEMIEVISAQRPLWGNEADIVARVRDPLRIKQILVAAGLPALDVREQSSPPDTDSNWLLKPMHGSGGRGITRWAPAAIESKTLDEPHYFQQHSFGTAMSASFLATSRHTFLIGVALQLVGRKRLGAERFQYCGSVAPIMLKNATVNQIRRIGQAVSEPNGLRGLFGVDFQFDGRNAWLTEINPRYTASMELFEHAYGVPLLDWHRHACVTSDGNDDERASREDSHCRVSRTRSRSNNRIVGKAILYASEQMTIPSWETCQRAVHDNEWVWIADRPAAGSQISAGSPICSILASGVDLRACRRILAAGVRRFRSHLEQDMIQTNVAASPSSKS